MLNLNIAHNPEELTVEESVIVHKDIEDGFIFSIPDVSFKREEFNKFIESVTNEFPDLTKFDYSRNKTNFYHKYVSEECRIYVRGNPMELYGALYTKSEENNKRLWDLYMENTSNDSDIQLFMHSFSMNGPAIDENIRCVKPEEFSFITKDYYPYIDTSVMFDQFFTGNENILLLVGLPGLGKSKLATLAMKYAHENPDKLPYDKLKGNPSLDNQFINIVFVKSVEVLANDAFWRNLEKNPPDFCIIDDLDYMLTKRDSEVSSSDDVMKNSFLNQFLSFTDGVEKHNTKFIITTNQSYDDIDAALLRKGRLFDILELRELDLQEALKIWLDNNLSEDEFKEIFKSHVVLPAELGSEINKRNNKRINTATISYLKEDDISKVKKAGRSKKIGM
jgi:DNA replication protein DnaC